MNVEYPRLAETEDETDGQLADILWYEAETRRLDVLMRIFPALAAMGNCYARSVAEAIDDILDGVDDADEG